MSTPVDDAFLDLGDALNAFKAAPSEETLDDVYRATTAIESACRDQLDRSN